MSFTAGYYGYSVYDGAEQDHAPYVIGSSFTSCTGVPVIAGEPVTFAIPNDHHSFRSEGRHKIHAQYTRGPLDVWVRYTKSGEQEVPTRGDVANLNFANLRTFETGYQQFTAFASYNWEIHDDLSVIPLRLLVGRRLAAGVLGLSGCQGPDSF